MSKLNFAFLLSLISVLFSFIYFRIYQVYLFDFSEVMPLWRLLSMMLFLSFSITWLSAFFKTKKTMLIFNLTLVFIALLSIIFPIQARIYHEFEDFFPAFAIPLHLIVPLFWLSLHPLLLKNEK